MICIHKISEFLRDADIEGLIEAGAPHDEYDNVAHMLYIVLADFTNEQFTRQNITSALVVIWMKVFNLEGEQMQFRIPNIEIVSQMILSDLK